jgi:Zn-dependent protease
MQINVDYLLSILYMVPVFLISISIHEYSHALVSYKMGDPTAKNMGRLTLNPLRHIDWLGALMFMIFRIGWAKPVQVNPMYYKNRRRGIVLTSLAGPLSNILLALIVAFPLVYIAAQFEIVGNYLFDLDFVRFKEVNITVALFNFLKIMYSANLMLAVFNLLPISPLDGSRILSAVIPVRHYYKYARYENYIAIIFLISIFVFPSLIGTIMQPLLWLFKSIIKFIVTGLVPFI